MNSYKENNRKFNNNNTTNDTINDTVKLNKTDIGDIFNIDFSI